MTKEEDEDEDDDELGPMQSHVMAGWQLARDIRKRTLEGRRGEEAYSLSFGTPSLSLPLSLWANILTRTDGYGACTLQVWRGECHPFYSRSDFKTSRAREASFCTKRDDGGFMQRASGRTERPSTPLSMQNLSVQTVSGSTPRPSRRASQWRRMAILRLNGNVSRCI